MTGEQRTGQQRVSRGRVAVAGALVVLTGLSARYGLAGWWSKYPAVALWDTLVYLLVLLAWPVIGIRRALVVALVVGWGAELAQCTPVPAWLSSRGIVLRWIFGMGFSAWDLPAYAAGAALGGVLHAFLLRPARFAGPTS